MTFNLSKILRFYQNNFRNLSCLIVFSCLVFHNNILNAQTIYSSKEKNHLERILFNTPKQSEPTPQKLDNITFSNIRHTNNYCVRLCDGFFFPVVTIKNTSDNIMLQEQICASFCPGTPTAFYRSNGSINNAVNANYTPYVRLETAFAYRKKINNSCSCKATMALGLNNLKYSHDFTLKKGDILHQKANSLLFLGSEKFPYKSDNFENVTKNSKLDKLTHQFFETLHSNDSYQLPRQIIGERVITSDFKPTTVRKVDHERQNRPKALSFQEFLNMRQNSIQELENQHASQN